MKAFPRSVASKLASDQPSAGSPEIDFILDPPIASTGFHDRGDPTAERPTGEETLSSAAMPAPRGEPSRLEEIGVELDLEPSGQLGEAQLDKDASRQEGLRGGPGVALSARQQAWLLAKHTRGYRVSADSARLGNLLRTVIGDGQRLILICGVRRGDAADMVAASAAVALALTGIGEIALADCDLRRPSLHHLFGLDQSPGTLSVISGKMSAEAAICNTGIAGLSVLPTERSDILPDTEFLDENRLARILKLLESRRGVIFCAPPLLDSPETLMLAARIDRTLLVTAADVGRTSDLAEAEILLGSVYAKALGVVLTRDGGR